MHFSTLALACAAFLTASVQASCPTPPKHNHHHHHRPRPRPYTSPVKSYSPAPSPTSASKPTTTLMTVTSMTPTPTPQTVPKVDTPPAPVETTTQPPVVVRPSPSPVAAPSAAPAPPASDAGLSVDQSAALKAQNAARADIGVAPPLTWDARLASDAQAWANRLAAQGSPGSLEHDSQGSEGENLYWTSMTSAPYADAADAWIGEKADYHGEAISSGGNFEQIGHYTQIIWASTTHVGMATASDGQGGVYVVARYSPPGNVIGQTPTSS